MRKGDGLEQPQLFSGAGLAVAACPLPPRCFGTDHTTVARRVQALEKELGLQLVDRRVCAYSLTPSGQRVCDLAGASKPRSPMSSDLAQSITRTPQGPVQNQRAAGADQPLARTRACVKLQSPFPDLRIALIGEAREASLSRREADLALRLFRPQ